MPVIAAIKIDVKRIPKERLYVGKKGTYLNAALIESNDGPDEYGNDGYIKIDLDKDARESGEKGEIIGNFRYLKKKVANPQRREEPPKRRTRQQDPDLDPQEGSDIPW